MRGSLKHNGGRWVLRAKHHKRVDQGASKEFDLDQGGVGVVRGDTERGRVQLD